MRPFFLATLVAGSAGAVVCACTRGPRPGEGLPMVAPRPATATAPAAPPTAPRIEPPPPSRAEPPTGAQVGTQAVVPAPANGAATQPAAEGAQAPVATVTGGVGTIGWRIRSPFVSRPPASAMRAAEYVANVMGGEALMTVFYFGPGQGGTVQSNIDRWVGQLTAPDGRPASDTARIAHRTIATLDVTVVEAAGRFAPSSMGGPPQPPIDDAVLLGAIATRGEHAVFFKLVGPRATIDAVRSVFGDFVDSLHPE